MWTLSMDITKQNKAERHFDEPTKDGVSISNVRDYKKGMDPHLSSGVFNKVCELTKRKLKFKNYTEQSYLP